MDSLTGRKRVASAYCQQWGSPLSKLPLIYHPCISLHTFCDFLWDGNSESSLARSFWLSISWGCDGDIIRRLDCGWRIHSQDGSLTWLTSCSQEASIPHHVKVKVKSLSHVQLFGTPWTVAYQTPPSMGFSRQEYWSGLPFPSPASQLASINWNHEP